MSETIASAAYAAVREHAGIVDLSSRGRILVSGSEVVMFLNGLITNDMKTLEPGSWMPAVFPNVQGRILAAVRVIHREDGFLVDTEPASRDAVLKLLERFTLAGDFHVKDISDQSTTISVQGKNATQTIREVLGETAAEVGRQQLVSTNTKDWGEVTIIRDTHTAEDGFDLFVGATDAGPLRDSLIRAGAQIVEAKTMETLRIEAGIPRYGIDMDETNVVTETGLDDAVSFTKGCYIGQEIIARIKYRGHVAKKLTGLSFAGEVKLESGAKILSTDDKEIGRVTSAAFSPALDHTIALGYVKYDYLEPGTGVRVVTANGEHPAAVAKLPFIRGSWYTELMK